MDIKLTGFPSTSWEIDERSFFKSLHVKWKYLINKWISSSFASKLLSAESYLMGAIDLSTGESSLNQSSKGIQRKSHYCEQMKNVGCSCDRWVGDETYLGAALAYWTKRSVQVKTKARAITWRAMTIQVKRWAAEDLEGRRTRYQRAVRPFR